MKSLIFLIGFIGLFCFDTLENSMIDNSLAGRLLDRRNRRLTLHRRLLAREQFNSKVCYELLGCFPNLQRPLILKRPPQHPNLINTQFYLYNRENRKWPKTLEYGDNLRSMMESHFNATKPLKVIVHGYKGSGNDGAIEGATAFLNLEDANVIIVDWAKGAGSTYSMAVSNVELVGRQLALILLDAANMGVDYDKVHLVGFSLGAHIAGCASEMLKKHNLVIGRITALDPASPLFRHNLLRDRGKKLDITDAKLVDVIHTDGSIDFADGFGLLKPIGHIDFFPNGGRQQPACNDIKNSVVVSHLNEDSLDINIACSHVRAWFLFLESLIYQGKDDCKFITWPCKRRYGSFSDGTCFPSENGVIAPEMGYTADRGPPGIYYLTTRFQSPYCGYPVRIGIKMADYNARYNGIITLRLDEINDKGKTNNTSEPLIFKLIISQETSSAVLKSFATRRDAQLTFYQIQTINHNARFTNQTKFRAAIRFDATPDGNKENVDITTLNKERIILVEKISLEDRRNNRWEWCSKNMVVGSREEFLQLQHNVCEVLQF